MRLRISLPDDLVRQVDVAVGVDDRIAFIERSVERELNRSSLPPVFTSGVPQELQLAALREKIGDVGGVRIARDLHEVSRLWLGVDVDRNADVRGIDTLFVSSSGEDDDRLEELASGWGASGISWIERNDEEQTRAVARRTRILVVRWWRTGGR